MIRAGDTVTLAVSGSADTPIQLDVNLSGLIELSSARLNEKVFHPGDPLVVTLNWRTLGSIQTNYVVFVHIIDPDTQAGQPVAQSDEGPAIPTSEWRPGDQTVDSHEVAIPGNQPAGLYQVRVGMYTSGQPNARLQVSDVGLARVDADSILIAEVEVQP